MGGVKLLQHFPYSSPREIQKEALRILGENWNDFDCFVVQAPTAFGKTSVAKTLMNAFHSVSVITPTNLLVEQFRDEFPDTPTLARLDSYYCDKWKRPCPVTRAKLHQFCSVKRDGAACRASADLATAKYRRGPGIYNYHTYAAHQLYRDVLVVDEAHNLIPFLKDRQVQRIWQHDYKYPHNMWSYEQIQEWISTLRPNQQKHKKIQLLKDATRFKVPTHVVSRTTASFNGKGTVRGEAEDRDCLELLPVDISNSPPILWPKQVRKIVLMSATIGKKDIEQLGLGDRRVFILNCASPIPPANRPIIPLDVVSVNRHSMENGAVEKLAQEIQNIAEYHKGEKGVIHATYQLSRLLRLHLTDSRFRYHDRETKREVYQSFREATDDSILVACGMYEGIDLPEDLGRWQVLAKVPWMSLGNPAIRHLAELDPDWYNWETIKTVIQACGRICRTPTDYGVTYILDKSFWRMYDDGLQHLPDWFISAVQQREDDT